MQEGYVESCSLDIIQSNLLIPTFDIMAESWETDAVVITAVLCTSLLYKSLVKHYVVHFTYLSNNILSCGNHLLIRENRETIKKYHLMSKEQLEINTNIFMTLFIKTQLWV